MTKSYELSRLACYLTAINADPDKGQVAKAQAYFAISTREAELARDPARPSTGLLAAATQLLEHARVLEAHERELGQQKQRLEVLEERVALPSLPQLGRPVPAVKVAPSVRKPPESDRGLLLEAASADAGGEKLPAPRLEISRLVRGHVRRVLPSATEDDYRAVKTIYGIDLTPRACVSRAGRPQKAREPLDVAESLDMIGDLLQLARRLYGTETSVIKGRQSARSEMAAPFF
jgi:hypothetical protein